MTHGITDAVNAVNRKRNPGTFNELDGWKEIKHLPSIDELNRFLCKRSQIDHDDLVEAAKKLGEYRESNHFREELRLMHGLLFSAPSGSVLMVFPRSWPGGPSHWTARLYIMGETTADHYSTTVRRFTDELERRILPAEAHAGDGG